MLQLIMVRRRLVAAFGILVLCALVLSVPASEAVSAKVAECNGVTLTTFDDTIGMATYEKQTFSIHLHNANASAVTVSVTDDGSTPIRIGTDSDQIVVLAGQTKDVEAYLSTEWFTNIGSYNVVLKFSVMDGVNPKAEVTMPLSVSVVSQYTSENAFNKFFGHFENNLPSPFNKPVFTVAITGAGWFGIAVAAAWIGVVVLRTLFFAFGGAKPEIGKNMSHGIFLCVIVLGVCNCIDITVTDVGVIETVHHTAEMISVIFGAMIIWDLYKSFISESLNRSERKGKEFDTSLIPLFNLLGKIVIVCMSIAIIMSLYGLDIAAIVVGGGIVSLGVSFGAKPAINELFSGLVVLITRPMRVGDTVRVDGGDALIVTKVGILKTMFVTGFTNEVITISNSKISSAKITNLTYTSPKYRGNIKVRVPFDSNFALIKKLLKEAASEHPNVITDGSLPRPKAYYGECKDRGYVTMFLFFYVNDYQNNGATCGQIREIILRKFAENGISVPRKSKEYTIVSERGPADAQ